ncbi:hypothetical protein Tco_1408094 [Tanacetum coccineum]
MSVLHLYCAGSGYQQKDRKPSQNDKTEHGMEKTVQNQGQRPKNAKVRVNTEDSAVKPEPELKNTIGYNLNPSDGPGKPNSIIMKTVKTKWALNQFQQPICVQLTKTVKTLKAHHKGGAPPKLQANLKPLYEHLNTQMTTLHDLIAQAMQKKEEEKRLPEEQAANEAIGRFHCWKIEDGTFFNHRTDTLREKLLNVNRLVAKIKALKDNPVPSSVVVTKSTSTFPNLFLEETNTFDNSFPESETFSFNLEAVVGSTTTHVDFSQYDSFIFDLSNDQFPPTDRSDFYHEEFAMNSLKSYLQQSLDCFFKVSPTLGNFTMDVVGKYFPSNKRNQGVHVLLVCPPCVVRFHSSSESHFRFCCMELSPFLFIPVIPLISSCGDEDTILIPALQSILSSSDVSIGIARICEDSRFDNLSKFHILSFHLGIEFINLID